VLLIVLKTGGLLFTRPGDRRIFSWQFFIASIVAEFRQSSMNLMWNAKLFSSISPACLLKQRLDFIQDPRRVPPASAAKLGKDRGGHARFVHLAGTLEILDIFMLTVLR